MPIERDLHELLYAHDCVIVPRFGGFLTHYRSARIDERQHMVHPPAKDISFNRHLTRSDGLLADHVARAQGSGFAQANAAIEGEVEVWQHKLERDGRLELPRIGTFYRDAERNLQFDPDRRVNFLKDAYGLRPVAAVPCAVPVLKPAAVKDPVVVPIAPVPPYTPAAHQPATPVIPITAPVRNERTPEAHQAKERYGFSWVAAAAVVALLSTAATWWVVLDKTPDHVEWSGFDLLNTKDSTPSVSVQPALPAPATHPQQSTGTGSEAQTEIAETPTTTTGVPAEPEVTVPAPAPANTAEVAVPESTAVAVRAPRARYHVIGGCFLQKDNADTYLANMRAKGFAASIIDQKGGLYRVAIGSYPERGVAMEALAAVRKEEAQAAWLLKQ